MRLDRPCFLGVLLLLAARGAAAQQEVHFMRESVLRPVAAADQALIDRVRDDLARVRAAQEAYYAANQTYASEVGELKGVKLSGGTGVVVLMSSPRGWKAEATNGSLKGAEVVHVMRMEKGEKCAMMDGGMKGMMQGMDGGRAPAPGTAPEHQH